GDEEAPAGEMEADDRAAEARESKALGRGEGAGQTHWTNHSSNRVLLQTICNKGWHDRRDARALARGADGQLAAQGPRAQADEAAPARLGRTRRRARPASLGRGR